MTRLPLLVILALTACDASASHPLCVAGHPAPRSHFVTYAGLPPRAGYQRDHIIPLCLGGADALANLQYQPLALAHAKDAQERRACEAFCRGQLTLEQARAPFRRD
jgi:hypothetical protein